MLLFTKILVAILRLLSHKGDLGKEEHLNFTILCSSRQCGAEQRANEGEAELTRGSLESGG